MKPLFFLTGRGFVNYCRRAVKSPQRLIGLLLIAGYYFQYFFRYLITGPSARWQGPGAAYESQRLVHAPPYNFEAVQAIVFWIFAFMSLMLFLTSLTPRGGFRSADIDVLFPTPVSPKVVLAFRMVRDSLTSLIFPLFFAVAFLVRPRQNSIGQLIQGFPAGAGTAMRLFAIAYVLMAICFVAVGYAISLSIYRVDETVDKVRKGFNRCILIVGLGTVGYVAWCESQNPGIDTFVALSHNIFLRSLFFIASAATEIVLSPLRSSPVFGILGLAGLVAVTGGALRLTVAKLGYLYDQAAQRGAQTPLSRRQQQRGDVYAQAAEFARQRKGKPVRTMRLLGRWTPRGAGAMIWKDLILQSRGAIASYALIGIMALAFVVISAQAQSATASGSVLLLASAGTSMFLGMIASSAGFVELLRRGDLQKPLPFSPLVIVVLEVIAKAIPILCIVVVLSLAACIFDVHIWQTALAAIIMAPLLSLPVLAIGLFVMLVFPDVDDAAQRSFRGFMTLLGSVIAVAPGVALAAILYALKVPPLLIAMPFAGICLILSGIASILAGKLYASFNPQE